MKLKNFLSILFGFLLSFALISAFSASSIPFFHDDLIFDAIDYEVPFTYNSIDPVSLPSGYSIYAMYANVESSSYNPVVLGNANVYIRSLGGTNYQSPARYGGFVVSIPPNNVPGYLYTSGIFPVSLSNYSGSSAGWQTTTAYLSISNPTFYFFSTSLLNTGINDGIINQYPSIGSVYVPAHDDYIYLYLFTMFTSPFRIDSAGVYVSQSPSIYFVPESSVSTGQSLDAILGAIKEQTSVIENDPMSSFEDRYLETQQDQLNQIEDMMTSSNSSLPNDGNITGFASDVQSGLGLSGSSFNPSDFQSATEAFGNSSAVSAGGPWEFFSQSVADSLSGGTSSVSLNDDDYIYQWLDESQRRYSIWNSYSP